MDYIHEPVSDLGGTFLKSGESAVVFDPEKRSFRLLVCENPGTSEEDALRALAQTYFMLIDHEDYTKLIEEFKGGENSHALC